MTEETAKLIFAAIMTIGYLFWLWSLQKTLADGRQTEATDWRMLHDEVAAAADIETGARVVRGEPEALSQALARSMLHLQAGGFAPLFEITERTSNRIAIKKTGPLMCNQPAGMYFSEAQLDLQRVGENATRVSYTIGFDRLARRVKNISLAIIFGAGLPLMLIVGGVVWYTVIPNANPAIRWQVLQTLQIVHGLWPPFLILGLYYTGRRQAKTYFSNMLSTLELAE
jgi:hypothetical protein